MTKVARNEVCPCGSGLKYKKCCLNKSPLAKHKVNVISSSTSSALSGKLFGKKESKSEETT